MKKSKITIFISIVLIILFLFNISFNVVSNATTSDLLISLGTGEYYIEVTKTTTVEDIIKILGEPKLTKIMTIIYILKH